LDLVFLRLKLIGFLLLLKGCQIKMEVPDNPWNEIQILNPCLSWQMCVECGISDTCIWPTGKKAGVFPLCLDCQAITETLIVFATDN
jgi:hypothetical protein